MIIDWTQTIKNLKRDPEHEDEFFETITTDLKRIMNGACDGDLVIIRFSEGFRAEVRFLNELGAVELKSIVKDFNTIRQYNIQIEKIRELRDQAADLLKDYPEKIAELDKYLGKTLEQPLFELNYLLNNKVLKSLYRVHYLCVHLSIMGMLMAFYQDQETVW